jgi:Asp-tRNA(Asn)/Glu-tRNA(Gln) amidotransferase C subunit
MANNKTSDKQISIEQLNTILNMLSQLKYIDVFKSINLLTNLKDIETNTNTKDTINKESNKQ